MIRKPENRRKRKKSTSEIYMGFLMILVSGLMLFSLGELFSGDKQAIWMLLTYGLLLCNIAGLKYLLQ